MCKHLWHHKTINRNYLIRICEDCYSIQIHSPITADMDVTDLVRGWQTVRRIGDNSLNASGFSWENLLDTALVIRGPNGLISVLRLMDLDLQIEVFQ
jgi:hypothetical protein